MTTWLVFGLGLGMLGAIDLLVAGGGLSGIIWGMALGLFIGLVGGVYRVCSLRVGRANPTTKSLRPGVAIALAIALAMLAIGSGVRAAEGPAPLYVLLIALSLGIFAAVLFVDQRK